VCLVNNKGGGRGSGVGGDGRGTGGPNGGAGDGAGKAEAHELLVELLRLLLGRRGGGVTYRGAQRKGMDECVTSGAAVFPCVCTSGSGGARLGVLVTLVVGLEAAGDGHQLRGTPRGHGAAVPRCLGGRDSDFCDVLRCLIQTDQ